MREWSHEDNDKILPPEVRERAVRMVREHQDKHPSEQAAIISITAKISCTAETLRRWTRQAQTDVSERASVTSSERERTKALKHENRELQGLRVFSSGRARPPLEWPPRRL